MDGGHFLVFCGKVYLAIYGCRQIVLAANIPLASLSGHIKAVSHWIQSGSKGQIKADVLLAK